MSDPAALATIADYKARHGAPTDTALVETRLADAQSLVRAQARQAISTVEADEITLDGDGSRRLLLPEIPVVDVTSVVVDDIELVDGEDFEWWGHGRLQRISACWPCRPRSVTITYTHGQDPVDLWITALVCAMVHRSLQPWASTGIRAEQLGDHQITYAASIASAGGMVWLSELEVDDLQSLRGPVLG